MSPSVLRFFGCASETAIRRKIQEAYNKGASEMKGYMEEAYSDARRRESEALRLAGAEGEDNASVRVKEMADELSRRQYK
jgi:hypothetical protein